MAPKGRLSLARASLSTGELTEAKPGLRGKAAHSLGSFQKGAKGSPMDAQSPAAKGPAPTGGAGVRPRPGEIEMRKPDENPIGSPAIGVRVAPGESARRAAQQDTPAAPTPAARFAPGSPGVRMVPNQAVGNARQPGSPPAYPAKQMLMSRGSALSPAGEIGARPNSPMRDRASLSSGMGRASSPGPGPKTGPQKNSLLKSKSTGNAASEHLSTMSTASVVSYSNDQESVQGRRVLGGPATRQRGMVPGDRGSNPVTGAMRGAGQQRSISPQRSISSASPRPGDTEHYKFAAKTRHAPAVSPSEPEPPDPQKRDPAWANNEGHYGRLQPTFNRGVKRNPFEAGRDTHLEVGGGCLTKATSSGLNTDRTDGDADATICRSNLHMAMHDSKGVKISLSSPPVRESDQKSARRCPAAVGADVGAAGASSDACTHNASIAWGQTDVNVEESEATIAQQVINANGDPHTANLNANNDAAERTKSRLQDSSQIRKGINWEHNQVAEHAAEGQEIWENYLKVYYGRSMKLGTRQESEPARSRDKKTIFMKRKLMHADWTQDESQGACVPCVSNERLRQCETHGVDREHKKLGEFSNGSSNFTNRLALMKDLESQQAFRIEQYCDKNRSASVPSSRGPGSPFRRNPVLGEGYLAEPNIGKTRPDMSPVPQAGMSTMQLATGAAVTSGGYHPEHPTGCSSPCGRGRPAGHGETPHMTSILQHEGTKDAQRIRALREVHDKPFAELCTAFNTIRESNVKDVHRIRDLKNSHASHNVASLLRHETPREPSRSRSCEPQLTAKPNSPMAWGGSSPAGSAFGSAFEQPAAGLGSARSCQSPAGFSARSCQSPSGMQSPRRFSSMSGSTDIRDALKWVC